MIFRVLVVLVLAVSVFACSSKDEKSKALEPADLVDFDSTIKVKRRWSADIGAKQGKRYVRFVPAVSGDRVYAADRKGRVFAFNVNTGKKIWKVDTELKLGGAVSVYGNHLLLGSLDGEVLVLNAEDGSQLWLANASSEILAPPVSNGSAVVAQTIDGRLFAFDASTGDEMWRYDHTTPILTLRGTSTPIMDRSQVIAAFDNGQVVSLNIADGALQWNARVSQPSGRTDLEKISDIDGSVLIDGGLVYAANYHGAVAAFSRAQGKIIWKQDISTYQNLAVGDGLIFVVTEESHIHAFNSGSGALVWKNAQLHRRDLKSPALIGDYLAVIDKDDHMHFLDTKDGNFAYRMKAKGDNFVSPLVSYSDGVLAQSADGVLSFYKIAE